MNLAKRAGLYTIRQKQKSILLFLVLMIVSTLVLTGIAIGSAVNNTSTNMHRNIAGKISIERNLPELDHMARLEAFETGGIEAINRLFIEQLTGGDFVTFDTLEAIMAIPDVSGYNITAEFQMRDVVPENFNFLNHIEVGLVNVHGIAEPTTIATIQSSTYSELMLGFVNGNLRLESGRHLTADDHRKVMISDELAEYNNLQVGDTMKISGAPTVMGEGVSSTTLEFEIIGIFAGTRLAELEEMPGHVLDRRILDSDTLIIDMATLLEEYERSNFFATGAVGSLPGPLSIFTENPNDIDRVYDKIVNLQGVYGKNFSITLASEGFEEVLGSLGSLQGLVQTLLVIIVIVSMAVLAILLTIWIRGRVKEIGIYLANGINKREILTQFIFEATLIAIIAFAFSLPITQVSAQGAGDYIISQFSTAQALRNEQLEGSTAIDVSGGGAVMVRPETGFMTEANIDNVLDMVDVSVRVHDLLWVYIIGLPVLIGSVLLASYTVIKLKPREILSKMN